jgi:hypothetical protein
MQRLYKGFGQRIINFWRCLLIRGQNYRVNDQGQLEISYHTESENGVLIFDELP